MLYYKRKGAGIPDQRYTMCVPSPLADMLPDLAQFPTLSEVFCGVAEALLAMPEHLKPFQVPL